MRVVIGHRAYIKTVGAIIATQPAPNYDLIIKSFGFHRAGSCSCGGSHNDIYRKADYALYYRKKKHVFKLKQKNQMIIPITSLTNLETELKKLFPDAVAVV